MLLYALTVFLGAFLLFEVQPLIGKAVLPWFGGAPAVWTTCMLFFQLFLLGGYLYAHLLVRRLDARRARSVHVLLIAAALAAIAGLALFSGTPLLPPPAWKPAGAGSPAARILLLLAATVGLPYLLLSTTGPLLQAWAARTHPRARVYRLYALSNAASLAALVAYPSLVERLLPLKAQARTWAVAFALFAIGSAVCAWRAARSPRAASASIEPAPVEIAPNGRPGARGSFLFWFLLAACGSTALLATTNQMCLEVAAIPFLWVLPLCLYLLSFVLSFESDRIYRRGVFGPLLAVGLGWAGLVLFRGFIVPIRTQVAAYSLALFAACMVCHGELARARPPAERLTSFYLAIAAGGAAGGIFVAVLAPLFFPGFWEIHIALFASALVFVTALLRDRGSWLYRGRPWPAFVLLVGATGLAWRVRDPQFFSSIASRFRDALASGGGRVALVAAAAALVVLVARRGLWIPGQPWLTGTCLAGALVLFAFILYSEIADFRRSAVSISRNFYGVLTVERLDAGNPESDRLSLRHGRIVHGFEYLAPEKQDRPTTYYAESSGIGLALLHHPRRASGALAVGAIGLGVGTLASYGKPGDFYCFYEINPQVERLSVGPSRVFRFVGDSFSRVEVHMGDARLSLERELASGRAHRFDVLAVDAFSSDSIPVHLLTREALTLYLAHLAPDGILALHLSNRHLNLVPVTRALAESLGLEAVLVDRTAQDEAVWGSTWVLLARDSAPLEVSAIDDASEDLPETPVLRVWTDDYSNLFDALK